MNFHAQFIIQCNENELQREQKKFTIKRNFSFSMMDSMNDEGIKLEKELTLT